MKKTELFPKFFAASLVVAVLCTICVDGGWVIWIPTILAVGVVLSIKSQMSK